VGVAAAVGLTFVVAGCERERSPQGPATAQGSAGTSSPGAPPSTSSIPAATPAEPSCETSGTELVPTDVWVRDLKARADATQDREDLRKAMKAALLAEAAEDPDCWEVRDGFDAFCGKPRAAKVTIECQQWWERALKFRSEPHGVEGEAAPGGGEGGGSATP
jgi:hypothetical protein